MNPVVKRIIAATAASAALVVPVSAAFNIKHCLPDLCDLGPAHPHEPVALTLLSTSTK